MLTWVESAVFIALLVFTVYAFFEPLYLRYRLIRLGKPVNRYDQPFRRLKDTFISFFFLQCSVKKERLFTGFMHSFILFGSLVFDTVSISHILEGFKRGFHILPVHSLIADVFAVLVLAGVTYFIIRRYVFRPKSYSYTTYESVIIYALLISVTLTFLLYEGSMIAVHPDFGQLAFAGKIVANWLPPSETAVRVFWWVHILNVFVFVVYIPRSKYLHMLAGPINIAFHNYQPKGVIRPIDIENSERYGAGIFADFTWKDLFDGFACVDCGRCEDYCPASQTEKLLSPKNLMINMRNALLKDGPALLNGGEPQPLMNRVFFDDEIWACTTCGACMHVCPVEIEHLSKLFGLRQGQVLMEGKFPSELKRVFKGLQTNANPWGIGADKRMEWAKDMDVPIIGENQEVEYLLYLGCNATFNERAQKVSQSLIRFLNKYGVSYGVLGEREICCGETARRLGEEALGQKLIDDNIQLFNKLKVKKILTPCPHCYNVFKNEYPDFGGRYEVIHHSQLISELIRDGRVKSDREVKGRTVIHDSCYLGRANDIYSPPRDILSSIAGLELVEHKKSKEHGFCCGAGGGRFWLEEKAPRINHERVRQLSGTGAEIVATSCPYCLKMLDDGIKDLKCENIKVLDLIEILEL